MTAALRRLRADLLGGTMTMTRARQATVDLELSTNPIAKADPKLALAVATTHGWPPTHRRTSPGERLLRTAKG